MSQYILAIDQGTSSTKTIIFDDKGILIARATEPLKSYFSDNGFVEQDAEEIYNNVLSSITKCIESFVSLGYNKNEITTCGISNQRETFVLWDENGKPLYNAVVWQCKRSIGICERLKNEDTVKLIKKKTGLIIDPYFSGSKIMWLNENNERVRKAITNGKAYFGTIDTWLLYKFTGNYNTDYTNASRTLLFNLTTLSWDDELLQLFGLSNLKLPATNPSAWSFGESTFGNIFEKPITITAMLGDSHAAAFGEGCFEAGTAKATLGTGSSILMNIGSQPKESENGMVTTICWSTSGRVDYAFEGVIVSCGSTIEWLKNDLRLIDDVRDTESIALSVTDNNGVYLVPAFSGLGAPHWDMNRKGSITGLTFSANANHVVRAALESIPYQIKDVVVAMEKDAGIELKELMVDGGISSNKFVLQYLADLLGRTIVSMGMADVSALGAAYMAGLHSKIFESIEQLKTLNTDKTFTIPVEDEFVNRNYMEWQAVIKNNM
jgi:glycerol kinase